MNYFSTAVKDVPKGYTVPKKAGSLLTTGLTTSDPFVPRAMFIYDKLRDQEHLEVINEIKRRDMIESKV